MPYGYFYERPIPSDVTHIKSDQEIIDELAGTMPLGEIARACAKIDFPDNKTELRARIDINWNKGTIIIDIYPILFKNPEDKAPLRYKYWVHQTIRRVKKYRNKFIDEKLTNIITGMI